MIIADYHVHSDFSSDSTAPMEQMIEMALRLGLKKLCFTDHMDIDYPHSADGYSFVFNLGEYTKKLEELKEQYKNRLEILIGIELGLQPHIPDKMKALTDSYPFDFVIGSSHVVNHIDPYYTAYWEGITEEEGVMRYFESIIDNCKVFQDFNVYGHIDYIVRYTPSMSVYKKYMMDQQSGKDAAATNRASNTPVYQEYSYEKYADILDVVLKTILSYQKGIEINTSGLKYGLGHIHPKTELLKRYKELGGELITIGSDAHKPEHLAYEFEQTAALLRSLGYRYYATFVKGKPVMEKL